MIFLSEGSLKDKMLLERLSDTQKFELMEYIASSKHELTNAEDLR